MVHHCKIYGLVKVFVCLFVCFDQMCSFRYSVTTVQGCQSLPAGHCGFVSRDTESGIVYVSQQLPTRPELCEMLRQGCVRSLSCEVHNKH